MKSRVNNYRGNTFYRLLVCFFVVILISSLLLTMVYLNNANESNQDVRSSCNSMAEKMLANSLEIIEQYQYVCDALAEKSDILTNFTALEQLDPETDNFAELYNMIDTCYNSCMSGPGNLVFLHFKYSGQAVTIHGNVMSADSDELTQMIGMTSEIWNRVTDSDETTLSMFVKTESMTFSRLMLSKEIYPGVVFIAAISEQNITTIFDSYYMPENTLTLMTAEDGSYFAYGYGTDFPDYTKLSTVISSSEDQVSYNDEPYFKYQASLFDSGVIQTILIPDTITGNWQSVVLNVGLIAIVLWLIFGIGLAYFMATSIYKPIQKLINDLPADASTKNDPHEFAVVDKFVKSLYQQTLTYEEQISIQNKMLADNLLLKLLKGELTYSTEIEQALNNANITINVKRYAIALIQPEIPDAVDNEALDFSKIVSEIRTLTVEGEYSFTIIELSEHFLAIIELSEEAVLSDVLTQLHSNIISKLDLPVTIAASTVHGGYYELSVAFNEAQLVLEHNLLLGEYGTIRIFSSQTEAAGENLYGQQLASKITRLINNIQTEDYTQAKTTLKEMFNYLSQTEYQSVGILQQQVRYVIETISFISNYKDSSLNIELKSFLNSPSAKSRKRDLNTIYELICNYFDNAASHTKLDQSEKRKIDKIAKYIIDNYSDQNLTARSVAEHFDISVSWMSNLFKKELNMGFLDCLHKCRIEKAKSLILNTDYTISKISEMVGYTNSITMSRAFKRYEGVTPNWYRAQAN